MNVYITGETCTKYLHDLHQNQEISSIKANTIILVLAKYQMVRWMSVNETFILNQTFSFLSVIFIKIHLLPTKQSI